ncbi:uncharacterized protein C2845_PM01G49360 [Panicum miliaceum]|uniref:Uncharacterized protein n=1 Tax=Panicum miliaceum TaxID=4540 RepID=A0A3L6TGS4_PANMI|nr:uncharacterized protein C2845_PM01G49360 [Panicum miliaceum]
MAASEVVWLSPASRLPSLASAPPRFRGKPPKPSAASLLSRRAGAARLPVLHRRVTVRRRLVGATEQQQGQVQEQEQEEVVDSNVLPYCSIDKKQKKTLGEMEQEFLQALQACMICHFPLLLASIPGLIR